MLGAAVGVTIAGAVAHGAFYPNSFVFGRVIGHLPSREPELALTFDDGPNPEATEPILNALGERGVKATFFVLGRHAERWPHLVRRIAEEGHTIGNHGYYHRKLHLKGPRSVREDLELGTRAIADSSGVRPRYFRAPHGYRSPWVTTIASSLGQRTVGWTRGVWDSAQPGVEIIVQRCVRAAKPGAILLLHDGDGYDPLGDRSQTARAVPMVLTRIHDLGLRFVTLDAA
jgi:peptidoglycan/xylan/chitin deacetylase (PgdA/CDA1 family)